MEKQLLGEVRGWHTPLILVLQRAARISASVNCKAVQQLQYQRAMLFYTTGVL